MFFILVLFVFIIYISAWGTAGCLVVFFMVHGQLQLTRRVEYWAFDWTPCIFKKMLVGVFGNESSSNSRQKSKFLTLLQRNIKSIEKRWTQTHLSWFTSLLSFPHIFYGKEIGRGYWIAYHKIIPLLTTWRKQLFREDLLSELFQEEIDYYNEPVFNQVTRNIVIDVRA